MPGYIDVDRGVDQPSLIVTEFGLHLPVVIQA